MTEILVIGNEHDTAIERLICDRLSLTYRVLYIKGNRFLDTGSGYELIVFDCETPVIESMKSSIVLAKRGSQLPGRLPEGCTAIINADNSTQLEAVRNSGVYVLDCGISPTSTVSFTGEDEESLMVSLNRSLHAMSGREIQPLEIPVKKHGADDYTLMSFTALRLLLDDFNSELGELI